MHNRSGFTLIELLTTIAIIAVLSAILFPSLSTSKRKAKIAACLGNIKQISAAHIMYAADDQSGSFSAKVDANDQDVNWLTQYLGNSKVWVCPETKNRVGPQIAISPYTGRTGLMDLINLATAKDTSGKSYQSFGFFAIGTPNKMEIETATGKVQIDGLRKSESNVDNYVKHHEAFGLRGTKPGPANIWIVSDALFVKNPYYPDNGDNHDTKGASAGFCDGHAEFIMRPQYIQKYELSQDENRIGIELTW